MKCQHQVRAGFSLIEIVAVLAMTSLVLVFASMLIVTSTGVFISNKIAAEDSQKMQVAMNRLVRELTYAGTGTVVVTNGRTVQWTSAHPDRSGEAGIATWSGTSGSSLTLQGAVLLDNVSLFAVSSTTDSITITMRSTRTPGVTNTTVVHPRYDL